MHACGRCIVVRACADGAGGLSFRCVLYMKGAAMAAPVWPKLQRAVLRHHAAELPGT